MWTPKSYSGFGLQPYLNKEDTYGHITHISEFNITEITSQLHLEILFKIYM